MPIEQSVYRSSTYAGEKWELVWKRVKYKEPTHEGLMPGARSDPCPRTMRDALLFTQVMLGSEKRNQRRISELEEDLKWKTRWLAFAVVMMIVSTAAFFWALQLL